MTVLLLLSYTHPKVLEYLNHDQIIEKGSQN